MKFEDVSRQWTFWVEDVLFFKRHHIGIFEGTEKEARSELKRRIEQTGSPYVRHGFDPK